MGAMRRPLFFVLLVLLLSACSPLAPAPTPTPIPQQLYRLRPGELILAANQDDIPAILASDELFVDAAAGDTEWQDEETVIGISLNGQSRAYPIRLLSLHEVVNDTLGGQPILVTWCPLCYSAIVFDPVVNGSALTFGVSGYLFRDNLVMYDHQTNTLWSQLLAQALRGAHNGETLGILSAEHTTWEAWKTAHPDTQVLSARQMGRLADEIVDPYVAYYNSGAAGLGAINLDDRLPSKTLIIGLRIASETRAYPFDTVRQSSFIHDQLAGLPVLLGYNPDLNTVAVYSRQLGGRVLDFESTEDPGIILDTQTQSSWELNSGRAISGQLQGDQLDRLSAPVVFWFAWSQIHPETELFSP